MREMEEKREEERRNMTVEAEANFFFIAQNAFKNLAI